VQVAGKLTEVDKWVILFIIMIKALMGVFLRSSTSPSVRDKRQ
jgi:hypothetical protein